MLSVRNRGDPKLPYPIRSLWMPIWDMAGDVGHIPWGWGGSFYDGGTRMQMTRIAIGLRLWLRRAIKRINERTMMRIVDMVNYDSLRALYKPIRIVELD